jgi:lipoprotein-anchoring transpeptidase ErfK/SrfK
MAVCLIRRHQLPFAFPAGINSRRRAAFTSFAGCRNILSGDGEADIGISPMRRLLITFAAGTLAALSFMIVAASERAAAAVVVDISRASQTMSVIVDGTPRYHWRVSTGRRGYGTPSGTYHPQSMASSWFSKEYYNSPMPHSIFFHRGYAIHGTYEIHRLGGPASHGCVRLDPGNAATLFGIVQHQGMGATTIRVH